MTTKTKTRDGTPYDEANLRFELNAVGDEIARLISRISLVAYRHVGADDNYTYNTLSAAEGAIKGALALVQSAELHHYTERSLLDFVAEAHDAAEPA